MYDDILLPTDGSPGAAEVLDHALAVATTQDATVHVLSVLDKRQYMAASEETKAEVMQALEEKAARAIEDAQIRIEEAGVDCVTTTTEGVPHTEILEYAESHTDLVVMGTHGATGPEQIATLGSTTERVVKGGDVPVLVVDLS
jgi:nucleotide-binding universal stress UspA family protein